MLNPGTLTEGSFAVVEFAKHSATLRWRVASMSLNQLEDTPPISPAYSSRE